MSAERDILARLHQARATPGIDAAAVIAADGSLLASTLPASLGGSSANMLAAMLGLGERISSELQRGQLRQVYVNWGSGATLLSSISTLGVLAVLLSPQAKLGAVLFEVGRTATDLSQILQAMPSQVPEARGPFVVSEEAVTRGLAEVAARPVAVPAPTVVEAPTPVPERPPAVPDLAALAAREAAQAISRAEGQETLAARLAQEGAAAPPPAEAAPAAEGGLVGFIRSVLGSKPKAADQKKEEEKEKKHPFPPAPEFRL
ncbi:MAG: roadblock/LC7 domain-containing protein [Chloroflexota bacterium]